jgi:phosphate-selective porin
VAAAEPAAADPGAAAFGQMANTLTKEPAAGQATTTPAATTTAATTPPAGADKMTPQQIAALKGRLKAGAGATSGKSGFSQYTKDASSERIVGADAQGNPIVKKINASKINTGNNLSEMLAANIAKEKKKLAEERAANYKNSSIFTK